jgi:hypothetical protein
MKKPTSFYVKKSVTWLKVSAVWFGFIAACSFALAFQGAENVGYVPFSVALGALAWFYYKTANEIKKINGTFNEELRIKIKNIMLLSIALVFLGGSLIVLNTVYYLAFAVSGIKKELKPKPLAAT